jgi:hypothetical protein
VLYTIGLGDYNTRTKISCPHTSFGTYLIAKVRLLVYHISLIDYSFSLAFIGVVFKVTGMMILLSTTLPCYKFGLVLKKHSRRQLA